MVSLFGILNVGARGVTAAQAGLDTTGQNIANANTEGYSRQRNAQRAADPLSTPNGVFGQGVEVITVERIRDLFLEAQIRGAQSETSFNEELNQIFTRIEAALDDPLTSIGDVSELGKSGGINNLLSAFFNSLNELSMTPESPELRKAAIEKASSLADGLRFAHNGLASIRDETDERVATLAGEANRLTGEIASLNRRIAAMEANPSASANDLRDRRDRALKSLSEIIPIRSRETANGMVNVSLLGLNIVDQEKSTPLLLEIERGTEGFERHNLRLGNEGLDILDGDIRQGKLGAALDARDRVVPALMGDIDALARGIIFEVNKIHSAASGLEGPASMESAFHAEASATRPDSRQTLDTLFNQAAETADGSRPFPVRDGSFSIRVANGDNETLDTFDVEVRKNDNLRDLVDRIDRSDGVVQSALSVLTFDPVYVRTIAGKTGAGPGEELETLANLAAAAQTPLAENPGAAQTFQIVLRDAAGDPVDADGSTPAFDPVTVTFDGTLTLDELASQIQAAGGGLIRAETAPSGENPDLTVLTITATRPGHQFSIQNDTSGLIRAFQFPITDPVRPLVGGAVSEAAAEFAGPPADSFLGSGDPAFSPAFPGPPPSVIGEGSFEFVVLDNNDVPAVHSISISDGGVDSIDELAAELANADPNINVQVTADNRLVIEGENGRSFFFQNDGTGLLKALGFDGIKGAGEVGEPFEDGSFEIVVANAKGKVSHILEVEVPVEAGAAGGVASIQDIVDAINEAAGDSRAPLRAEIVSDPKNTGLNRIRIAADGGYEFTFRSDDSLILSALGFADGPVLKTANDPPIEGAEAVLGIGDDIGPRVRADITAEGRVRMETDGDQWITFAGDGSHFLAAAGFNTFFEGDGAASMRVNGDLLRDAKRLATSGDGAVGNNSAVLAMAELENRPAMAGQTIGETYRSTVAALGLESNRAEQRFNAANDILRELETMQEQTAGVSLDEESINLIKYQQAFQASARVINAIDQMLDIVINRLGA